MTVIAFNQILTMVILLSFGVCLYKIRIIDENANKRISELVLFVINPIVIFMSYIRPFERDMLGGLFTALLLAFASFAIAILTAHTIYRKKGGETYAVEKLAAIYPNCGFFGIPLINGIFGGEGVFYLAAYLTAFNLLIWTHGVYITSGIKKASHIRKAFLSPAVIAVCAGFIFFALGIPVPDVIANPLAMLGSTNTPLAMIVAGVSIANTSPLKVFKDPRIYKLCLVRLVIIPVLYILAQGLFDIQGAIAGVIIIASACPCAANVVLFALRYGKDHVFASELFAATTVLSMATIPVLLYFTL